MLNNYLRRLINVFPNTTNDYLNTCALDDQSIVFINTSKSYLLCLITKDMPTLYILEDPRFCRSCAESLRSLIESYFLHSKKLLSICGTIDAVTSHSMEYK